MSSDGAIPAPLMFLEQPISTEALPCLPADVCAIGEPCNDERIRDVPMGIHRRRSGGRVRSDKTERLMTKAAARQRVGDIKGALHLYGQVLAADPDNANALNQSGLLYFMTGDTAAGLDRLRRSVQISPDDTSLLNNAGECLRMAGKLEEAETLLRQSLALAPSNPDTLNFLGLVLLDKGAFGASSQAFHEALSLAPGHAGAAFNLGALHMARKRPDLALSCFDAILAQAPRDPDARAKRGEALLRLERDDEAAACFEAVLAHPKGLQLDPMTVVAPLCRHYVRQQRIQDVTAVYHQAIRLFPSNAELKTELMGWLLLIHQTDEARALALKILEKSPHDLKAARTVAKTDRDAGRLDAARQRLEAIPKSRWDHTIFYEMGSITETMGDFDTAFDLFDEANRRLALHPDWQRLKPAQPRETLARARGWSTPDHLSRIGSTVPDDGLPAPIFLVGFNRSGTTLLENVIGASDQVVISDEKPFLSDCFATYKQITGVSPPVSLEVLTDIQAGTLRATYWAAVERLLGSGLQPGQRLVDKLPLNLVHLPLLRRLFPNAPILVALRDPRDVIISNFKQFFGANNFNANFLTQEGTVEFYADVMQLWLQVRPHLPGPWREVRYEDVVTDFETTLKDVLDFLGLAWDDNYLGFHNKAKTRFIFTPSASDVVKPVYTNAVGRWQGYTRQLAPFAGKQKLWPKPLVTGGSNGPLVVVGAISERRSPYSR